MITPAQVFAVVIALIASVTDIRSRKIPNWLTFPGAMAGILCQWWQAGSISGMWLGIQGWFLALAFMLGTRYLAYVLGRAGNQAPVGFGDIKLMAALGACLGPSMFLCQLLLFSVLFAGFSFVKIITSKNKISQTLKTQIPLAPFMALATICSIWLYQSLNSLLGI